MTRISRRDGGDKASDVRDQSRGIVVIKHLSDVNNDEPTDT